jgi:hypothetical protein
MESDMTTTMNTDEVLQQAVDGYGKMLNDLAEGVYWKIESDAEKQDNCTLYDYEKLIVELMRRGVVVFLKNLRDGLDTLGADLYREQVEQILNDPKAKSVKTRCKKLLQEIDDPDTVLAALELQEVIAKAEARDYLDDPLDNHFMLDRNGGLLEATITLATGGPHITVDTSGKIRGCWGFSDAVETHISRKATEQVYDFGESLYEKAMMRLGANSSRLR